MATTGPVWRHANLTIQQKRAAVPKLERRLADLDKVDVSTIRERSDPGMKALSISIDKTLADVFGPDTFDYRQHNSAANLDRARVNVLYNATLPDIQEGFAKGIEQAKATLGSIRDGFNEDIADEDATNPVYRAPAPPALPSATPAAVAANSVASTKKEFSRRVFVVHGHDVEAKLSAERALHQLGFEPIILHDQPNRGRAIIEKFEACADVGFAVVLLTPDDVGGSAAQPGQLRPRARQNVIMELGYFLNRLGRERVCALTKGDVELPSDYAGVLYVPMDAPGAWKLALVRELRAVGYDADSNKLV